MKLLFCRKCGDVVKCQMVNRACLCGLSSGRYLSDGDCVEIAGEHATVIAMDNFTLAKAVTKQPETGKGIDFKAWVFAKDYFKIKKVVAGILLAVMLLPVSISAAPKKKRPTHHKPPALLTISPAERQQILRSREFTMEQLEMARAMKWLMDYSGEELEREVMRRKAKGN